MKTYHEELYRTPRAMARLRDTRVTICGAGALGANLTESLARIGFTRLKVIDRDRVEERNLSTQPYGRDDIGSYKVTALAHQVYREVEVVVEAVRAELQGRNVSKLLSASDWLIDCFDNSAARQAISAYARSVGVPCLHAGLADGYSEVLWEESYRVPSAAQDDVCDYPLARNLVTMTVAVTAETLIAAVLTGQQVSRTLTLKDLKVLPYGSDFGVTSCSQTVL